MTYAEIRTHLIQILNRSDCTNALADTFIEQGMQRSQRILKLTSQERIDSVTVGPGFTGLDIPNDFIAPIAVYSDAGTYADRKLRRVSLAHYLETPAQGGLPLVWTKDDIQIKVRPAPSEGSNLKLLYLGEFEPFEGDDSLTTLSTVSPQLFIYGGLVFAGDYFIDDRQPVWEDRYLKIVAELQAQSDEEELAGGAVIQPAYMFNDGEYY